MFNPNLKSMNKLPKVLQKEIDEFAHGDRKHWQSKFDDTKHHVCLIGNIAALLRHGQKTNMQRVVYLSRREPRSLYRFQQWLRFKACDIEEEYENIWWTEFFD